MSDEALRRLEREAAAGDPRAALLLAQRRARAGALDEARDLPAVARVALWLRARGVEGVELLPEASGAPVASPSVRLRWWVPDAARARAAALVRALFDDVGWVEARRFVARRVRADRRARCDLELAVYARPALVLRSDTARAALEAPDPSPWNVQAALRAALLAARPELPGEERDALDAVLEGGGAVARAEPGWLSACEPALPTPVAALVHDATRLSQLARGQAAAVSTLGDWAGEEDVDGRGGIELRFGSWAGPDVELRATRLRDVDAPGFHALGDDERRPAELHASIAAGGERPLPSETEGAPLEPRARAAERLFALCGPEARRWQLRALGWEGGRTPERLLAYPELDGLLEQAVFGRDASRAWAAVDGLREAPLSESEPLEPWLRTCWREAVARPARARELAYQQLVATAVVARPAWRPRFLAALDGPAAGAPIAWRAAVLDGFARAGAREARALALELAAPGQPRRLRGAALRVLAALRDPAAWPLVHAALPDPSLSQAAERAAAALDPAPGLLWELIAAIERRRGDPADERAQALGYALATCALRAGHVDTPQRRARIEALVRPYPSLLAPDARAVLAAGDDPAALARAMSLVRFAERELAWRRPGAVLEAYRAREPQRAPWREDALAGLRLHELHDPEAATYLEAALRAGCDDGFVTARSARALVPFEPERAAARLCLGGQRLARQYPDAPHAARAFHAAAEISSRRLGRPAEALAAIRRALELDAHPAAAARLAAALEQEVELLGASVTAAALSAEWLEE